MKNQRGIIKLTLKERQDIMLKDQIYKNERKNAIKESLYTKKVLLARLEEKINAEEQCEIPDALNEELEGVLEEYQEVYSHENILLHEQRLSEEKA